MTMTLETNKHKAQILAVERAVEKLKARHASKPFIEQSLRVLGRDVVVTCDYEVKPVLACHCEERSDEAIRFSNTQSPSLRYAQRITGDLSPLHCARNDSEGISLTEQILVLHYLLCENPTTPTGELISFRELPGGQFYLNPYRSRSLVPLADHFKNDVDALRTRLDLFDWMPVPLGDVGARVHAVGSVYLTLVYYKGEDDFEPSAEILFDSSIKHIFCTEDATVLGTRLCRGLIGKPCLSCSGCGACPTRNP